jgi:hypothetical protein
MADGDKAPEVKTDEKAAEKKTPTRRAPAKAEERDSVVNDKVNMVDGKPEKIADNRTTTEAAEGVKVDNDYAPTPWVETNDKLDNRKGDQQVTPESWASVPQHVNGGEVSDKRKLDNSG